MALVTPGFVVRYRTRNALKCPDQYLAINVADGVVTPRFVWVSEASLFGNHAAAMSWAKTFPVASDGPVSITHHAAEVVRAQERTAVELAPGVPV